MGAPSWKYAIRAEPDIKPRSFPRLVLANAGIAEKTPP